MHIAEAARALALGALVVSGWPGVARAQANPPQHPHRSKPPAHAAPQEPAASTRPEPVDADPVADAARARVRAGDCAGALDGFDAALRTSSDSTLLRDRGLCHEALGHPFPAMDDLRAYLTAAPDATDADEIRTHLASLEQRSLGYSSASNDVPGDVEGGASQQAATAKAPQGARAHAGAKEPATLHSEAMETVERDDDGLRSPLRAGKGWSLAPFVAVHKWGVSPGDLALTPGGSGASFSAPGSWAECIGGAVRYATGRSGALLLEVGYEVFDTTSADLAVVSGLTTQLAFEWRFPLDGAFENELLVAPGLGFEHLAIQPSAPQASSTSLGGVVPRVRIGWRHMLAPSVALETALDGGVVDFFAYSHTPFDPNGQASYLVAVDAAIAWGL